MTLPRLHEMQEYWEDCPPVHISANRIARYFGVSKSKKEVMKAQDFLSMFKDGKLNVDALPK